MTSRLARLLRAAQAVMAAASLALGHLFSGVAVAQSVAVSEEGAEAPEARSPADCPDPNEAALWERPTLTGSWLGLRTRLDASGVALGAAYTADAIGASGAGGPLRGAYVDDTDLTLTVDLDKLAGWSGAGLFIYGLGNEGIPRTSPAGATQTVSSLDVPEGWNLVEAWFQQRFWDDGLSLLVGLYNVNGEFSTIEPARLFLNAAHGMGTEFSGSGENGPSNGPDTSLAARVKVKPGGDTYVQAVVADGVPGDPNHPHGTHVRWDEGDGLLVAGEAGVVTQEANHDDEQQSKLALGGWYYTASFDVQGGALDPAVRPERARGNFGVYGLVSGKLGNPLGVDDAGLAGWVRLGLANPRFNSFADYLGAGLVYTGLLPERHDDQLGLSAANAFTGGPFRAAQRAAGEPLTAAESVVELTYRVQLATWLFVQPDFQCVIHPSAVAGLDAGWALGSRFGITL